jgi:hypothetical protein
MPTFHLMHPGLLVVLWVPVLVGVILVLVAGRRDDDPGGTRTQMRYVGAIGLVTLFLALFAFYGVAHALTNMIVTDAHIGNNGNYRSAMDSGLLGIAAAVVFVFHYRRARVLAPADGFARGATGSAAKAALYVAAFAGALIALLAAARGIYGLFRLIVPGVSGPGIDADVERERGIAQFLSFGFLAAGGVMIFLRSWYWLPEHRG